MGWHEFVFVAAVPDDEGTDAKKDCREKVRKVVSDVFLRIDHANLTDL